MSKLKMYLVIYMMQLSKVTSSLYVKGTVPLEKAEVKCLDQEHSGEHDLFNIILDL